jgi:hypothetical protein
MNLNRFLNFVFKFITIPAIEMRYHWKISFIKVSYIVSHLPKKNSPHRYLSRCHKSFVFVKEIVKIFYLNKFAWCMVKHFNAILTFSIYNKYGVFRRVINS